MAGAIILRTALFASLWWVLGGALLSIVGVGSIILTVVASIMLLPPEEYHFSLTGLPGFLLFFLTQSVKGGTQVAIIALRPQIKLYPDIVEIPLRLADEGARVFLANTMNLLPGTLSVGLDGKRLHLHVLDQRQPMESNVREAEKHIARLLKVQLQ